MRVGERYVYRGLVSELGHRSVLVEILQIVSVGGGLSPLVLVKVLEGVDAGAGSVKFRDGAEVWVKSVNRLIGLDEVRANERERVERERVRRENLVLERKVFFERVRLVAGALKDSGGDFEKFDLVLEGDDVEAAWLAGFRVRRGADRAVLRLPFRVVGSDLIL